MADYQPPELPLSAIFNPLQWLNGNTTITSSQLSNYVTLNTSQNITGQKNFNGGLTANSNLFISSLGSLRVGSASAYAAFTFAGSANVSLTLPDVSGTLALLSNIPTPSDFLTVNDQQTAQNKTVRFSSNTSIASFTSTTITTSFAHGLVVGDVIQLPSIGSMTGIVANTSYTIATVPSTTQFTLSGITTMGGTVGTAYYILITRFPANYATAGGLFTLADANNAARPLYFDLAGATQAIVLRFPITSATPLTFPANGGALVNTTNTQTISGALTLSGSNTLSGTQTFTGQLVSTRAGNATVASAPIYINPSSSTAMTGANSYFWTYLNTPVTSGTTTGQASTFTIAGPPTVAASGGNYSSRILAGISSIPSGTAVAPSLVFGTNNGSGLYSSANNVINIGISGTNVFQTSSTGVTVAGLVSATTLAAGAGTVGAPAHYLSTDTNAGWYRPSAGNWTWVSAGNSVLALTSVGITITGTANMGAQTILPASSNTVPGFLMNAASLYSDVSGTWKFQSGANLRMTLDNTGATVTGKTTTTTLQVGANGSTLNQIQQGVFTFTSVPINANTANTQAFTFPSAFSSAPNVQLTINYIGVGGGHEKCIAIAASVTTTGLTIYVYNTFTAAATGNISIAYLATN